MKCLQQPIYRRTREPLTKTRAHNTDIDIDGGTDVDTAMHIDADIECRYINIYRPRQRYRQSIEVNIDISSDMF